MALKIFPTAFLFYQIRNVLVTCLRTWSAGVGAEPQTKCLAPDLTFFSMSHYVLGLLSPLDFYIVFLISLDKFGFSASIARM